MYLAVECRACAVLKSFKGEWGTKRLKWVILIVKRLIRVETSKGRVRLWLIEDKNWNPQWKFNKRSTHQRLWRVTNESSRARIKIRTWDVGKLTFTKLTPIDAKRSSFERKWNNTAQNRLLRPRIKLRFKLKN